MVTLESSIRAILTRYKGELDNDRAAFLDALDKFGQHMVRTAHALRQFPNTPSSKNGILGLKSNSLDADSARLSAIHEFIALLERALNEGRPESSITDNDRAAIILEKMKEISPEYRIKVLEAFCIGCGTLGRNCNCMRDE